MSLLDYPKSLQGKFINDRAVLLRCADSVGLKDAESALQNESTASRTVRLTSFSAEISCIQAQ